MTFAFNGGTVGAVITFPLCGNISIIITIYHHHFICCNNRFSILIRSVFFITNVFYDDHQYSGIIIENSSWVWVFYVSAILTLAWVRFFMYSLSCRHSLTITSYVSPYHIKNQALRGLVLFVQLVKTPSFI